MGADTEPPSTISPPRVSRLAELLAHIFAEAAVRREGLPGLCYTTGKKRGAGNEPDK